MLLFAVNFCYAQEGGLIITNLKTQKQKIIKETRRIKVKMKSGKKRVGRLQIVDKNTIGLSGIVIALDDIEKIKRHSFVGSMVNTLGWIAFGTGTLFMSALAGSAAAGIFFGMGSIIMALQPVNLFEKGYSSNKKWAFSIKLEAKNQSQMRNARFAW